MDDDRGGNSVNGLTSKELLSLALNALKETARDVDERRVPLDGRVRLDAYRVVAPPVRSPAAAE
jgi:hypothetical protein